MNFWEIALSFVGGGALVALIGVIGDRWKFRQERKAKKEDRAEEKADKTVELHHAVTQLREADQLQDEEYGARLKRLEDQMAAVVKANKIMMLDRILHIGVSYIDAGEITLEERRRIHEMHDCYHNDLGGNGDAKLVMEAVDELPLKK